MSDPNYTRWDEIDILHPLRNAAIEEYKRRNPEAQKWPEEKLCRLSIRSETRWARTFAGEQMFVVNTLGRTWDGDGTTPPRGARADLGPMGEKDKIHVNLWAFLKPGPQDPGFAEPAPYCSVSLSQSEVRKVPVKVKEGVPIRVQLADFLVDRLPNKSEVIRELHALVQREKERVQARVQPKRERAEVEVSPGASRGVRIS